MEDLDIGAATENARGASLLKSAEQRRAQREKHLFLDIPSWDGDLIGEYALIEKENMVRIAERMARKMRQDGADATIGDIELIVQACVGLHARDPQTGDRVPIEDEFGIVKFDRIASVLGVEDQIKSNADAVRYLTAERSDDDDDDWTENVTAINRHAAQISRWMRDPSRRSVDLEALLSELA